MGLRYLRFATGVLVVAAVVLISRPCWAHWYDLGASKDEWGVKYQGEVDAAEGGKLNVRFTLADQGRLKPIHSVYVMALNTPDGRGAGTYVLKTPMTMKATAVGKLTGQVVIGKEFANRAMIRIFTYTVDGRSQNAGPMAGARYYDIPLRKFLNQAPSAAASRTPSSTASPPAARVAK